MKYSMRLAQNPFIKIKKGSKIIEARLFDKKRQLVNAGDFIEFAQNDNLNETVFTKVKALYCYETFNELFSNFPISHFGGNSKRELLDEIHRFYPAKEEKRFGVVGIKFEIVDKKNCI